MIRVFLVDDTLTVLILKKMLSQFAEISVIGTAQDKQQALELIAQLKPDVVCSAANTPELDSLELTRQVMDVCPTPILILSTLVRDHQQGLIAQFLDAGAVDTLVKPNPENGSDTVFFTRELARKIKVLAGVTVFRRKQHSPIETPQITATIGQTQQILVIGASTGGPQAFEAVLSKLPANYPFPVICIQHISKGFLEPFILWLGSKVKLPIAVAQPGEKPQAGHIYFAPDHANLEINGQGGFFYSHAPEYLHYPSVNVTFASIAQYFANKTIAVLLTGMGDDGASGLKAIADAGGITIAQDEASSVVFGMPKTAIDIGAAQKVLNLEKIAETLCHQLNPSSGKYLQGE